MSIFGNLEIGKTGLNAAQLGQSTTGHNIANVNTEGFSRQRVEQSSDVTRFEGLQNGVRVDGIDRMYDIFNSEKVIDQASQLNDWSTRLKYLQNLEAVYQDLEGRSAIDALNNFWVAWAGAATSPESNAERANLASASNELTSSFDKLDRKLFSMQQDLTVEMSRQIEQANVYSSEIATLNQQIFRLENQNQNAGDLKDQRDELIQKLSKIVDINWFYNNQNQIDVQLSSSVPLVRGNTSYNLEVYNDLLDPSFPVLGYKLSGGKLINVTEQLKGGAINGLLVTRDQSIAAQREKLNTLAGSLTREINALHSPGTGIEQAFTDLSSQVPIETAPEQPITFLKDGQLSLKLQPNSKLEDSLSLNIDINAGVDSLETIVEKINAAAEKINPEPAPEPADPDAPVVARADNPIKAEIDADGQLRLKAGPGYSFYFDKDTSGLMSRIGLNPFFVYKGNVSSFKLREELDADPSMIALGYDQNPGDNRIALAINDLQHAKVLNNNTSTFEEFYLGMHQAVGSETQNAIKNQTNHQNIFDQYLALKNSVTGVNVDEEMANMIKYQRAYEASAKYISTIDKMTETLISM